MKLRNIGKKYGSKLAVLSTLSLVSASSFAALPVVISTSLADIQADGLAMAELIWPVVAALFGAALLFKLFKRFGNKI